MSALEASGFVEEILYMTRQGILGKRLIILLVILICFVPAFVLAERKKTAPYFNTVISHVIAAFDGGKLVSIDQGDRAISDPYKHGHIGYQTILLTVAKVCGVSPKYVQFLPVGGLLVPFLYFILFRKMLASDGLAFLFAIYIAYEPMLSKGQFNVHAYAWSRTLFLTFFILCIHILDKRTAGAILLLLFVFVGTFLIYWTTPVWMLTLWASISVIPILQTFVVKSSRNPKEQSISLALVFVVIYLAFSKVLYQYIPAVADAVYGGPEEGWAMFSWQIKNLIMGDSQGPGPYEYAGAAVTNQLLGWLLMLRYIVLFLPHAIYALSYARDVVKTRSLIPSGQTRDSLLLFGGVIVVIVHSVSYALRGHMSLRPALFVLPITGILCLDQLKLPRAVRLIFPLTLVLVAVSGFFLHYQETSSYDVESSAQWLLEHSEEATVLTDMNTAQKYLLEQVESGRRLTTMLYDPLAYQLFVEGEHLLTEEERARYQWDYVVIDHSRLDQPLVSGGWRLYEPLSIHLQDISDDDRMNVIYDEGRFLILQTR